ncbi:MAG: lyso-ornithine lipid O-acyltransferase [Acidobacteriota bacterium]
MAAQGAQGRLAVNFLRSALVRPLLAACRALLVACATGGYLVRHAWECRGADLAGRRRITANLFTGWARVMCRLLGLQVEVLGPLPPPGSLIAPNHQGYLDVIVLAAAAPMTFVSKAEVQDWPIFGFLLRRADQIVIQRARNRRLLESLRLVSERLSQGFSVCVFLEGTTSSGEDVLSFHPSLLQPAIDAGAMVVPVAVTWETDHPDVVISRDVAYWGDHVFALHLLKVLGLWGIRARIHFGNPLAASGDRAELAARLEGEVRALRGGSSARRPAG